MGNTHYSIATVLTAFMGGLALGSYAGGKVIDRFFNPLALYALLEGAIGIYCLAIPSFIDWAFPLFKSIYLNSEFSYTAASFYRFLICGSILLIPTTFMGATLPILSKFVSSEPGQIGRDVGTLYGINTFGAVFGADHRPKAGMSMRTTLRGPPEEVLYMQKLLIAVKAVTHSPPPEGGPGRCRGRNDSFFLPLGSLVSAPWCISSPGTVSCLCC